MWPYSPLAHISAVHSDDRKGSLVFGAGQAISAPEGGRIQGEADPYVSG